MEVVKEIFKNRNWKVRLLQIFNHLLVIIFFTSIFSLNSIISYFIFFCMFCIGINIGVHRYFSHGSFKTSPLWEYFFITCFTLSTVGSSLAWIGMHREHHKYSDTDEDPHTPVINGSFKDRALKFFKVYFGVWNKYTAKPRFTCDIRSNQMHRFFHFYYVLVILSYMAILFAIGGIESVFYYYSLPAVMVFHAASFIVTYGHTFGYTTFNTKDSSKNSFRVLTVDSGLL